MNLSHAKQGHWRRFARCRGSDEALHQGTEVESSVESVLEFGQVSIGVLSEVEGVVRTRDGCLQVAQHGVDRLELRDLARLLAAPGHNGLGARPVGSTSRR